MLPCSTELRQRYLHQTRTILSQVKRHTKVRHRATKAVISRKDLNLLLARKKIAKCTQLSCRIKSQELIMLICFMRYIIEMRYAKKTTFTPIKCRETALPILQMQKISMRVGPRGSHNSPSLRCMIHHHLIPSSQSLSLMVKAPTLAA